MRVIAGTLKGRQIKAPKGLSIRPTRERAREALFSMLAPSLESSRFLDLCAGTGAIGIEALSRGAESALFVEKSVKACRLIGENLKSLGLEGRGRLLKEDILKAIKRLSGEGEGFDLIYLDLPYKSPLAGTCLKAVSASSLLKPGGIFMVEHEIKREPPEREGNLLRIRTSRFGDTAISFYRRGSEAHDGGLV